MRRLIVLHFTIGMDPNIATFGGFTLAWHGIATAVAIIVAVYLIYREFIRKRISIEHFDAIAFWTIVGGIIGARVFFLFDHPIYMLHHPSQALKINEGGLAIYGALIGGFIAVALLMKRYGLPFRSVIDACAPGLLLAQAVGRIGCTINGDAWGAPTSSPFAFVYTNPKALIPANLLGVPTHPYPIYDMALCLAIFAVVWGLRKRDLPAGALFCIYAVVYAIGRFFITYFRQERIWFWGLQEAQVISLLVLILAAAALVWIMRARTTAAPVPATVEAD